jgi:hypothetical protein
MEVSKINPQNFGMAIHISSNADRYMKKTLSEDELRLIKKLMLKNKNLKDDVFIRLENNTDDNFLNESVKNRKIQAIAGNNIYEKNPKTSTLGFLEDVLKKISN